MKTLIENSIKIFGMGHPETKTIFSIENEDEINHFRFKPLTKISGRKLTVSFKYTEDGVEAEDKLQMTIVKSDDENTIKNFILAEINNTLV